MQASNRWRRRGISSFDVRCTRRRKGLAPAGSELVNVSLAKVLMVCVLVVWVAPSSACKANNPPKPARAVWPQRSYRWRPSRWPDFTICHGSGERVSGMLCSPNPAEKRTPALARIRPTGACILPGFAASPPVTLAGVCGRDGDRGPQPRLWGRGRLAAERDSISGNKFVGRPGSKRTWARKTDRSAVMYS